MHECSVARRSSIASFHPCCLIDIRLTYGAVEGSFMSKFSSFVVKHQ